VHFFFFHLPNGGERSCLYFLRNFFVSIHLIYIVFSNEIKDSLVAKVCYYRAQ